MNYVILSPIKCLHDNNKTNIINEHTEDNNDIEDFNYFDDVMYEEKSDLCDTDKDEDIKKYQFDTNNMVSYEEAKLTGKTKHPFVLIKTRDKKNTPCKMDIFYKIVHKRKDSSKDFVNVGYLDVSNKYKPTRGNIDIEKLEGFVNEDFPIWKNKGFNKRNIGYLKLSEETDYQEYYVQLVCNRSWWWLLSTVVITLATVMTIGTINWGYVKLGATTIVNQAYDMITSAWCTIGKTDVVDISYNSNVVVNNTEVPLGINVDEVENLEYKVDLYIEDDLVYRSDYIKTGEALDKVNISGEIPVGEHSGRILIRLFKNDKEINDYVEKYIKVYN